MKIRDATPADLAFIVQSNEALATETEGVVLDRSLLEPGVRALLSDPSRGRYFIAEADGRPAGQLMITFEWSDWRNGVFWWIQSVYVQPEQRGSGVFAALFGHLRRLAGRDPGVCGIRLYVDRANARAQAVYARLGMHRSNYGVMEMVFRGPESHAEGGADAEAR